MWRRGRFGPFIACSNYPNCKYIKKKEAKEIGLLCPECGQGQVVERKGRWGRFFYGCKRYPECKFTAYHQTDSRALPGLRPQPTSSRRRPSSEGQGHLLRQRGLPLQAQGRLIAGHRPSLAERRHRDTENTETESEENDLVSALPRCLRESRPEYGLLPFNFVLGVLRVIVGEWRVGGSYNPVIP